MIPSSITRPVWIPVQIIPSSGLTQFGNLSFKVIRKINTDLSTNKILEDTDFCRNGHACHVSSNWLETTLNPRGVGHWFFWKMKFVPFIGCRLGGGPGRTLGSGTDSLAWTRKDFLEDLGVVTPVSWEHRKEPQDKRGLRISTEWVSLEETQVDGTVVWSGGSTQNCLIQ